MDLCIMPLQLDVCPGSLPCRLAVSFQGGLTFPCLTHLCLAALSSYPAHTRFRLRNLWCILFVAAAMG